MAETPCAPQSVNPELALDKEDYLYHLGFSSTKDDLVKKFGDVKFVCCGSSPTRFEAYSKEFAKDTGLPEPKNLSDKDRFVMYKTGPVLWMNCGMGSPSLSIMLNETLKLMHYAKATEVTFIRMVTSGGVGIPAGSVVVTSDPMNGELKQEHVQWIAGKKVTRQACLDKSLQQELMAIGKELSLPVVSGKTLCADDFYEGQTRRDGYFCDYSSPEKIAFLVKLFNMGVRNFEMESTCFASFATRAGIRAAIVNVTLLDRFDRDQVPLTHDEIRAEEMKSYILVSTFIKRQLSI